jgi:Na+/H+-translocating membrane pyrophosphatase
MRSTFLILLAGLVSPALVLATTLEKLSVEQMAQKATAVVRGRVEGCSAAFRGRSIYTNCTVRISERWKGETGATASVSIPGGSVQGLTQSVSGAPSLTQGQEYVLFLWTGQKGVTHLIGLSQGAFELAGAKTDGVAQRAATGASLLDSSGREVADDPVEMRVSELRNRVRKALAGGGSQ